MSTRPTSQVGTDFCPDHPIEQRDERLVARPPYAPMTAGRPDIESAPRDGVASVPGPGSEVSSKTAGPGRETALSYTENRGRTGTARARSPQGRWPPATPARRTRPPYDLTDPALGRVRARPRPDQWDPDEPLTLHEAAALMFPAGPITAWTLRTARRQGQLGTATVAGRIYTSVEAVRAMTRPSSNPPGPPDDAGAARVPVDPPSQPVSSSPLGRG